MKLIPSFVSVFLSFYLATNTENYRKRREKLLSEQEKPQKCQWKERISTTPHQTSRR
jgi:hypothetical protein